MLILQGCGVRVREVSLILFQISVGACDRAADLSDMKQKKVPNMRSQLMRQSWSQGAGEGWVK